MKKTNKVLSEREMQMLAAKKIIIERDLRMDLAIRNLDKYRARTKAKIATWSIIYKDAIKHGFVMPDDEIESC